MVKKLGLFFVLTATFFSCRSIMPAAPEIEIKSIKISKQPVSTINIPIQLELTPYFNKINRLVPNTFIGNEQQCEGVSYSYYIKRKPIEFSGIGKRLLFGVEGSYWIKLNYCPKCSEFLNDEGNCLIPRIKTSCGIGNEPMRKLRVSFSSSLGLSENYNLKSKTVLEEVQTLNPCKVTIFNFDATSKLKKEISSSMNQVAREIDTQISRVNFRQQIEQAWNVLWQPISLGDYGYLHLKPQEVSVDSIFFKKDTAYCNTSLKAFPNISTDHHKLNPEELPKLSATEKNKGFNIYTDISAGYDSLSSTLTKELKGTVLSLKGRKFVFEELEIHGASNQMIAIQVNFTGKTNGTIYLVGTPTFNSNKQHISFPDLEFDLNTKSMLLKSAKWMFDKKITNALRQSASIDLKPTLDHLKTTINNGLNRNLGSGILMTGNTQTIKIDLIHPRENDLFLRLHTLGTLSVQL
ncbi:DUF4403 family protein [Crocinitomicaceae bacterium]|nr:DUF4403 family protein [Crocinitomicaceae bacterium]